MLPRYLIVILCVRFCITYRRGVIKCATIEEIEAEKSSIEKDAVSVLVL